jgi:hypothetical protein
MAKYLFEIAVALLRYSSSSTSKDSSTPLFVVCAHDGGPEGGKERTTGVTVCADTRGGCQCSVEICDDRDVRHASVDESQQFGF